ncbi:hypothetical protein G5I_05326 [Acromyrmex echinatior]|uniref:Uncharacterized protein n=1 Tax=Acromyrmex echinatior TaxID=103372 RepID=F4WHX9_ACREC|nr:hypothetical protein G5I_05326 [Acromyrmex echinatior]
MRVVRGSRWKTVSLYLQLCNRWTASPDRRACPEFSRQKSLLIGQHPRNFRVCNLEDWRKRENLLNATVFCAVSDLLECRKKDREMNARIEKIKVDVGVSHTAGMKDGKRIYKALRIVLNNDDDVSLCNSDASLSPDIIGLVSSLPVPFCIEYLGKPQVDIVLQNGASSDTRFSSGEKRKTYWLSAKLSNGRSKRNTLN